MPKEYNSCKESEISKGKSEKDAKRICAISYYKRHGKTPMQAEKEGKSAQDNLNNTQFDEEEVALFGMIELVGGAFKRLIED